jgi:hypothetical protein
MRASVTSSIISHLAGAAVALWLGAGPASAGSGGGDGGIVQPVLNAFCNLMAMSQLAPSCPQLPRATQVMLEYAALANVPPDFARGPHFTTTGGSVGGFAACSVAGNEGIACSENALNAVNQPEPQPIGTSDLANLTPLAFKISNNQAVPTEPNDPAAVSFLYAVTTTTGVSGQPGQLDTLQLFYDNPSVMSLTSSTFPNGTVLAQISLPLQVLSKTNGAERLLCGNTGCPLSVATLQISACTSGSPGCVNGLAANVLGDFSSKISMLTAAALGLQWQLVPGSSIFEVQVPLLVTGPTNPTKCGKAISAGTPDPADCGNDPAYFGVTPANATIGTTGSPTGINQASSLPTAFSTSVLGFTPASLATPVGIAPHAAPACLPAGAPGATADGSCPAQPNPQLSTFPFCASFSGKKAVAAFYAVGTNGAVYLSAPVVTPSQVTCPF